MNFNPLPEEQQHPELLRRLQETYRMSSEDKASLDRIQTRLFQRVPTLPQEQHPSLHSSEPNELANRYNGSITHAHRRTRKPWHHYLSLIAAVLVVLLITGTAVSMFVLIKGKSQPAVSSRPAPVSSEPRTIMGHRTLLDEKGLFMATSQVGWAIPGQSTAHGPLLRTLDGGKSWKQVTLPRELSGRYFNVSVLDQDMAFLLPMTNQAGFSLSYFYRTVDGGGTWQRCTWPTTPDISRDGQGTFDWTFLDHTHGWVSVMRSLNGGTQSRMPPLVRDETLFRTDDGGLTWQQVAHLPLKYAGVDLTFTNAQTGWLITAVDDPRHPDLSDPNSFPAALYVSHDGGHTWKQQHLPIPPQGSTMLSSLQGLTFFTENMGYFFARFGSSGDSEKVYLYMTRDGGNSWQISGTALPTYGLTVVDATHSYDGTFLFTLSNGQWVKTSSAPPGGDTATVEFLSSQAGIALVNNTDVYRTSNGGKTWKKIGTLPKEA
jgi:photosystem II stability/assembly factor-like uncharacterized protein